MIDAVVFDLDDTLYLESDFVASGYRAVAQFVSDASGVSSREVFYTMMSVFATHGRQDVLPSVIGRYLDGEVPIARLVEIYRSHTPKIRLLPGYAALLRRIGRRYRTGIITDGLPEVQKRKVAALGLDALIDEVIYTWEHGVERQKPDTAPFSLMLERLGVAPERALYVGDNAAKDCRGAHRAGMQFAHVRPRPAASTPCGETPEFVIETLYQLPDVLARLDASSPCPPAQAEPRTITAEHTAPTPTEILV